MEQRSEQTAKYKITEEPSWTGENRFFVYKRYKTFEPGIFLGSYKWSWKYVDSFDTLAKAEEYVRGAIAYQEAKDNPKVIGYY